MNYVKLLLESVTIDDALDCFERSCLWLVIGLFISEINFNSLQRFIISGFIINLVQLEFLNQEYEKRKKICNYCWFLSIPMV